MHIKLQKPKLFQKSKACFVSQINQYNRHVKFVVLIFGDDFVMYNMIWDNHNESNADISCVGDVDWIDRFNDTYEYYFWHVHLYLHERPSLNHCYTCILQAANMDGQKCQAVTKKKILMKSLLRIVFWWKSICQQVHLIAVIAVLLAQKEKNESNNSTRLAAHTFFSRFSKLMDLKSQNTKEYGNHN